MSRLKALVSQHHITIDAPVVPKSFEGQTPLFPTPFTLHFQGRSLRDEMHSGYTILPSQAVETLFILADAGRTDPTFRKMSTQKERQLKHFLGTWYEAFWQAFSQDQQEELERQQAATRASFAAAPKGDELVFQPGERVRYLGDGRGLRKAHWINCTIVREIWRKERFLGILVRRESDGVEVMLRPESLRKKWG